ncbi:MAG: hypothetical protein IME94_08735 [Proteobacteria bacterium]|nr:hypothetical protein [Pseudomonadota bacterium]
MLTKFKIFFHPNLSQITTLVFVLTVTSFQAYAADIPNNKPDTISTFNIQPMRARSSEQAKYKNLDQQLSEFSEFSDLIFHGKVVDVEYLSAETETDIDYPLTYITFSIIEFIQGDYVEKEIILMMPGVGYTKHYTFVLSSHLPTFAKDDELVIFLANDMINGPKYVHHFFVIDNNIYDDESCEILINDNDEILRGEIVPQSKIFERPLGVGTLRLIRESSDINLSNNEDNRNNKSFHDYESDYSTINAYSFKEILQKKKKHKAKRKKNARWNKNVNKVLKSADPFAHLLFSKKDGLVRRR